MSGSRSSYRFGPFRLDAREHRLFCEGRPVPLTPKVFDVLRVLVEHSGHLVEKEILVRTVWPDNFVEEGALNRSVSILRKALAEHDAGQPFIETIPKRGYRFVVPVTAHDDDDESARAAGPQIAATARRRPSTAVTIAAVVAVLAAILILGRPWFAGFRPRSTAAPSPAPVHRQVTFTGNEGAPAISPDGRRIAYVSNRKPEKKLVVQELAGGTPLEIFSAPEIGYLRWSPDGSELLMWTRGSGRDGVYVLPQLGGSPHVIAPRQFIACWSPDGSAIAVASNLVGKIWLFDTAGRLLRTLTLRGDHWSIWDMDWSKIGDRLLFVSSDQQGRYTIGTVGADGGRQETILSASAEIPSTRWVPAGDAIYYFERVNQTVTLRRIAATAANASARGVAVATGLETDRFFSLSTDGRRLAYARAPYHSNLEMLDAITGRTTPLTRGTSLIERPRVSPDGTTIVFSVGHDPLTNLFTLPVGGGTPRQLTFFDALTVGGAWSADGKRIAFASTQGGQLRIWTVPAEGGTPAPVPSLAVSDNLDVAWSPGLRILYQRAGNRNYSAIDPRGAVERLLVEDGAPGWMFAPVSSPGGRYVAVMWNRRPNRGVWIIDTHDHREKPVYPSGAASLWPIAWNAEGTAIYVVEGKNAAFRGATSFVGETMTEARILRVASNGAPVETVAAIPAEEIGSVSMTPDGRRFVYPVFSSRSDVWVVDEFDERNSGGFSDVSARTLAPRPGMTMR